MREHCVGDDQFRFEVSGRHGRESGRPVAVETERFRLRTLTAGDVGADFLEWIADSDVMHPLNMPARQFTAAELKTYITGFDNHSRYLVGMFDKDSDTHIGILSMDINITHSFGKMSFLVGHPDYRRIGAFRRPPPD